VQVLMENPGGRGILVHAEWARNARTENYRNVGTTIVDAVCFSGTRTETVVLGTAHMDVEDGDQNFAPHILKVVTLKSDPTNKFMLACPVPNQRYTDENENDSTVDLKDDVDHIAIYDFSVRHGLFTGDYATFLISPLYAQLMDLDGGWIRPEMEFRYPPSIFATNEAYEIYKYNRTVQLKRLSPPSQIQPKPKPSQPPKKQNQHKMSMSQPIDDLVAQVFNSSSSSF